MQHNGEPWPEVIVGTVSRKVHKAISLAAVILLAFVTSARGAGIELYPTDSGTAGAGQAAIAEDASTAASNPAGMTLLDRSQLLTAPGVLLPSTNFDVAPETTTSGGGGGNAGVFFSARLVFLCPQALRAGATRRGGFFRLRSWRRLRQDVGWTPLHNGGVTHHWQSQPDNRLRRKQLAVSRHRF